MFSMCEKNKQVHDVNKLHHCRRQAFHKMFKGGKGCNALQTMWEFPLRKWKKRTLDDLARKIDKTAVTLFIV